MSGSVDGNQADFNQPDRKGDPQGDRSRENASPAGDPGKRKGAAESDLADELAEVEASLTLSNRPQKKEESTRRSAPQVNMAISPLVMVETAFLASTAGLLWLISYYLSIGPWVRILFPTPIALAYLRWGHRAAWMSALVSGLLLAVLMGPYLSILFCVPYALLGVQLGAMWRRQSPWLPSIGTGTLIATFGFFFRMWLLSVFLGEDLWAYLTNRITDFIEWGLTRLVDWGWLGIGVLGDVNPTVVQLATVGVVLCSDFIYLFTVHLAAWLLLERLGNPIPDPPDWVQTLLEEER